MDSAKRTLAKTVTWQVTGFISVTALGYLATGSLNAAGGLALASMISGTICYVIHERLWSRVAWGKSAGH